MSCPPEGSTNAAAATTAPRPLDALDLAFDAIATELALISGDAIKVDQAAEVLAAASDCWSHPAVAIRFAQLADRARLSPRALTPQLLALFCRVSAVAADPWALLAPLLQSSTPEIRRAAVAQLHQLIAAGRFSSDSGLFDRLAALVEEAPEILQTADVLDALHHALEASPSAGPPLMAIYLAGARHASRRLAARLLDRSSSLPSAETAAAILGTDLATRLESCFAYTRATHLDLLELASGDDRRALASTFEEAERLAGAALVRAVVAELGWKAVNCGLTVRTAHLVSVGGSFPLVLTTAEAELLDGCPGVRHEAERLVFLAVGSSPADDPNAQSERTTVDRFRACNLRHADVLADFLDIAPLTEARVTRLCERMDAIVDDFCTLFETHTDECGTIREIYGGIRARIAGELPAAPRGGPLSADLTRLVQMFEDPRSASEIRTLHGCKRYLHQRGLRLGFKLAEAGRSTSHAVALVVADRDRVLRVAGVIDYVDFEAPSGPLPPIVQLAADACMNHLLHGTRTFPKLKFFCYGNEVHGFVTFRNHPAFIRVDFSPPARGGMVDLEYCGVSKFDLNWHPNLNLPAIETIFRHLDFQIEIVDTRVRARYDKERASSLHQLADRVVALLHLTPALMDLDWVIGDLQISAEARRDVAGAWAEFFAGWGILPIEQMLTKDRLGILSAIQPDPAGDREIRWTGAEPYRDIFSVPPPAEFWPALGARVIDRRIGHFVAPPAGAPVTQHAIESALLAPLRRAVARGELVDDGGRLAPAPVSRFRATHEARLFANILGHGGQALEQSAGMARLAVRLEGSLRFDDIGTLNGFAVQRATIALPNGVAAIGALRDREGLLHLAVLSDGDIPSERRDDDDEPWRANWTFDPEVLLGLLRRHNYSPPWVDASTESSELVAARVRGVFAEPNPDVRSLPSPSDRVVPALGASPGRAVGLARIGLAGRRHEDVAGAIIVESALSPADNPFVFRAAGIITTGGGILSHAALLALQFHKPAVVVAGQLERSQSGSPSLGCARVARREVRSRESGYDITEYHDRTALSDRIDDGDVVVVDADAGTLTILGQDPDTLAVHDELNRLSASARLLAAAQTDMERLVQRGTMLRARHQLARLLGRIRNPALARHAAIELLVGEAGSDASVLVADKTRLLAAVCANTETGEAARAAVLDLRARLGRRLDTAIAAALRSIPTATDAAEILALRLDAIRLRELLENVDAVIGADAALLQSAALEETRRREIDPPARIRLDQLFECTVDDLFALPVHRARHAWRQTCRLNSLLGRDDGVPARAEAVGARLAAADEAARQRLQATSILWPDDGGLELRPLAGGKASYLAEAARFTGRDLMAPWFVVSNAAFARVLAQPIDGDVRYERLSALIRDTLARRDWPAAQKAAAIASAWHAVRLPADLVAELGEAYRRLADMGPAGSNDPESTDPAEPFVAVRSSASEEDSEADARPGEFDTFLFVQGQRGLVESLRKAWAGFWNERAIHNRMVLGATAEVGGGLLVQRMVWARASGVLHTINLAGRNWRELVINVGLGLGEGIVSGAVAADQIVVSKTGHLESAPLQFRYLTNDKRERVVFDRARRSGTRRVETLYHQRMRPALEYVELVDLVHAAVGLERALRQPLDVEFALEGAALRLLQVRPVPAAHAAWAETAGRHPLSGGLT